MCQSHQTTISNRYLITGTGSWQHLAIQRLQGWAGVYVPSHAKALSAFASCGFLVCLGFIYFVSFSVWLGLGVFLVIGRSEMQNGCYHLYRIQTQSKTNDYYNNLSWNTNKNIKNSNPTPLLVSMASAAHKHELVNGTTNLIIPINPLGNVTYSQSYLSLHYH